MVISKSVERRLESMQRDKQPQRPDFPDHVQVTYDRLNTIINEGGERAVTAYMAMTRLCVHWAANAKMFERECDCHTTPSDTILYELLNELEIT